MPADLDVALLKLTSEDERCMTLSVQNLTCPVYDLDTNVLFEGVWQVNIVHGPWWHGPFFLSILLSSSDCFGGLTASLVELTCMLAVLPYAI